MERVGLLGGNGVELEAVGFEALEIRDIAGGDGGFLGHGGGGDHAIGMRTAAAAGVMEKPRGLLGLRGIEGVDLAAEDGEDRVLLLAGMGAVAEFRLSDG